MHEKRNWYLSKNKNERRLMESIVDVQARLEIYRETGRNAVRQAGESRTAGADKRNMLLAEEHHPTKVLEEFMRAVPMPNQAPIIQPITSFPAKEELLTLREPDQESIFLGFESTTLIMVCGYHPPPNSHRIGRCLMH